MGARLSLATTVGVAISEVADEGTLRAGAGRAVLRHLTASRTGVDPSTVRIDHDSGGRPVIVSDRGWHASVSHSGRFVACAIARRRVGIDIERDDRPEADEELARRFCTSAERAALERVPSHERQRALIRLWVRKEALTKALGVGLALPFTTVDVRRTVIAAGGGVNPRWTVRDLESPTGYLAAVAVEGRCLHLSVRRLTL